MKAIHNEFILVSVGLVVGNYKLKYNFESNSQPDAGTSKIIEGWEL